ncbi:hypothetical protein BU16DRAFT_606753 [Lophium mytilinum]|uniref:Genetic interactor of prohibitins 3, mitochondrial n=1 Tax=Lophium mytilinum TaxID=390894 RepID=A0A6A6R252_9PEZI|nr:hypothetical protein BU16DRAFT_606753 [Lophium mytilinum]
MRPALRQASKLLQRDATVSHASIPLFLCPALLSAPARPSFSCQGSVSQNPNFSTSSQRRRPEVAVTSPSHPSTQENTVATPSRRPLPLCCPGCGAPTQTVEQNEAGFFSLQRGAVRSYINYDKNSQGAAEENIFTRAIKGVDQKVLGELGLDRDILTSSPERTAPSTPVCDRCHKLIHHHAGTSIFHPSIEAISDTIAESPHKHNHIYHVIDAADFPMSIIPKLQSALQIPQLRTQNRRSKHTRWQSGDRVAEVSFIITRSDLLAPLKEQVDKLMPYVQEVLRDALGRSGKRFRLGNVRLVSAKRGWWTKEVKADIWERGGGGWMVGKVNVGKSNLFEVVYPKGRGGLDMNVRRIRSAEERVRMEEAAQSVDELMAIQEQLVQEDEEAKIDPEEKAREEAEAALEDDDALLPPPQIETAFPVMPIISSLPGTTASPIRVPFGNGRGELIDLPGLARSDLESYVRPEHRLDLVMNQRISAQKHILKPGQSLLLGGLVRITPRTPDLVFIAHPFVPIDPHVTSTEKAEGIQAQTRESGVSVIAAPGIGEKMKSAGVFKLKWDVTKKQTGPLTSKSAGKMKADQLPFTVYSADILVEGCGWVELVAQVRKSRADRSALTEGSQEGEDGVTEEVDIEVPEVEVFSPEGKFVDVRRPMSASVLGGPRVKGRNDKKVRPRPSMKSMKARRRPGGE